MDGNANVVGNADIIGNVMLTTTSSLVQQVKIRATTASTDTTGALVVSGGANTKCECWWKRILSDIGSSGDANVDGGMNVVGNADISGNVMLTTTSSLVQQVKIRQRRSPQTQTRGVGGVWWGRET
jgi:carbonic anhydrase/acetyltransferase-like protein (isoleucine patch superfamily)